MTNLPIEAYMRSFACAVLTGFMIIAGVCSGQAQQAPTVSVASFLANPSQILALNPDQVRSLVASLATADPSTLELILGQVGGATGDQKEAIGKGLADAAKNVVDSNQPYSTQIQTAIIRLRDETVRVAFTKIIGDTRLGGIGAGPGALGGLGGGIGGQTNPQNGSPGTTGGPQSIGSPGTATGPFTYSSSVTGLSNTVTTSNNPSSPVSQ